MNTLIVVLAACVGLVIGSFLNVVVWRVPRGESISHPRSHCPECDHPILPRDNVPVASWMLLRGRCRHCRARISVRYPLVEVVTACVFAAISWRLGANWGLPAFLYLAAIGVALALIDLDVHRLPDQMTLPSYAIGGAALVLAAVMEGEPGRLLHALVGMIALYALYFVLAIAKPGGMGFGDVKLAGLLGMFLGYLGWGSLLVGAFLAFLLGGIGGIGLILFGNAGRKSKIPFGPFMIMAALIAIVVGSDLAHWYHHVVLG